MTIKQARTYLRSSGFSTEQIEEIQSAFEHKSVIEDIKADLDKRYDEVKPYDIQYASGLEEALEIIERHCGGDTE